MFAVPDTKVLVYDLSNADFIETTATAETITALRTQTHFFVHAQCSQRVVTRCRTLAVAVLLLTAGCSGGLGGLGDESADENTVNPALAGTPTATPSPTATAEPTPSPTPTLNESLPPSLTSDSVDARFLADAHRRALTGLNRTIVRGISIRTENESLLGRSVVRLETDDQRGGGRISISQTVSGPSPESVGLGRENTTYWSDGSVTVTRRVDPNGTVNYTFERANLPPAARADTTGEGAVVFAFAVANVTEVERVAESPSLFRVRGSANYSDVYDVRDISLVATVTADGLVRGYRLSYVRERGGEMRRIVRTFRVLDIGETRIGRPEWYETARNASQLTAGAALSPFAVGSAADAT
jgi:hypothetical protein